MSRPDELRRFTMSLAGEDYDRLSELADLLGVSRAALLRELIESARPVWAVLLDAARNLAAAPAAQREAMAALAEQMGVQLGVAQTLFDEMSAALATEPDPEGPPASNTGVTTS